MRRPARQSPRLLGVLALATLLCGCARSVPRAAPGVFVPASGDAVAVSPLVAPAWAHDRVSIAQRETESRLDQELALQPHRPDAFRPRRATIFSQDNSVTFFRLEGVQFRERSTIIR